MVAIEMLKMYAKYGGDADGWARMENPKFMTDNDWGIISGLVQDWFIIKSGLASKEFIESFDKRIAASLQNDECVLYLKSIKNIY